MAGAQCILSVLRGPLWPSIVLRVEVLLPFGRSGRSPDCPARRWFDPGQDNGLLIRFAQRDSRDHSNGDAGE